MRSVGSTPSASTRLRAVIELGFLAALQAVIGGFDSHTVHQICGIFELLTLLLNQEIISLLSQIKNTL